MLVTLILLAVPLAVLTRIALLRWTRFRTWPLLGVALALGGIMGLLNLSILPGERLLWWVQHNGLSAHGICPGGPPDIPPHPCTLGRALLNAFSPFSLAFLLLVGVGATAVWSTMWTCFMLAEPRPAQRALGMHWARALGVGLGTALVSVACTVAGVALVAQTSGRGREAVAPTSSCPPGGCRSSWRASAAPSPIPSSRGHACPSTTLARGADALVAGVRSAGYASGMSLLHALWDTVLVRGAEAEVVGRPPTQIQLLADSSATGGALSTVRVSLAQGADGARPHHHKGSAEMFYVLEGGVQVLSGSEIVSAERGDLIVVPPHLPHAFAAARGKSADLLIVITPGVERFGYFRKLERIAYGKEPPESLRDVQELYDTYFLSSPEWDAARAT